MEIPDYFNALNIQYGSALNDAQASEHAKRVAEAWLLTLSQDKQAILLENLPTYLIPKKKIFFDQVLVSNHQIGCQSDIILERLKLQLQKTDDTEVRQIVSGFFKTLKIILSNEQKFQLARLLDKPLYILFVKA